MLDIKPADDDGIIGILIDGDLSDRDIQAVTRQLDRAGDDVAPLRVLLRVREVGSVEPSMFWDQVDQRGPDTDVSSTGAGRAAIVTDKAWKAWFSELLRPFVGDRIRLFQESQVDGARQWLLGQADEGLPLGEQADGPESPSPS